MISMPRQRKPTLSVATMHPTDRHAFLVLLVFFCWRFSSSGDQFQSCTRYTSFGYGYRDFFEYREANFSPNQVFYLEFYVKTSSDAHVLLTTADLSDDVGYEIVIGGGSNTFSQIRLVEPKDKKTMITQKTEDFLSADEYRSFWISLDKLGIVSVGKKEDDEVFINWRFDNPLKVKYFSFGSWTNMKADWRFGCKQQKDSDIIHEERQLSPQQKLKRDLFTLYDPNALPVDKNETLKVRVSFQIRNVQLDEKRGELTLFGSGNLEWRDPKMTWKADNYDGIRALYVPPFQIWTPSIRVLNALAIDRAPLFDLTAAGVMVKYDGSILWRAPFRSVSFCTLDLKSWPVDEHNCSVLLGFWMEPANLVLAVMDDSDSLPKEETISDWEVVRQNSFNTNEPDDEENYGILYVVLRRRDSALALVLTLPYVAASVMSLGSFWVSFNNSLKLYLSCGGLVLMLLTLFLAGQCAPAMTQTVPTILVVYSWSTVLACVPIVLFVILQNVRLYLPIPQSISKILSNSLLTEIFCLPEMSLAQSEYSNLNDEVNKANRNELNALRLVTVVERLFFLLYLSALIVITRH